MTSGPALNGDVRSPTERRASQVQPASLLEDMAEEQGWVSRMVHLFKSDDLDVQLEVSVLQ